MKCVMEYTFQDLHTVVFQSTKKCFYLPVNELKLWYVFFFFLSFRNNNKSSSQQSSSSSSSSSLSSCSSSSALAQELSQQTAVIPESDSNSQVDWTYDPNEPRYCICNQVKTLFNLKYNQIRCFTAGDLALIAHLKTDQNFNTANRMLLFL